MSRLTRRQFLKLTGSAAASAVLLGAGCAPEPAIPTLMPTAANIPTSLPPTAANPTSVPSATALPPTATAPVATALPAATAVPPAITVPAATATAMPTVSALPASRADLMRIYPAAPSRVVRIHHGGVWNGGDLSPQALSQMLDAAITKLTGLNDAGQAWKTLFDPGERIALKVNTILGSSTWTHVPLVNAITDRLQAAGVPAEQITVYDRTSSELQGAGFKINRDGPGVRCYATDGNYSYKATVAGQATRLSDILMKADALINVPLFKQHGMAGFSFAFKNHYGTINNPPNFHYGQQMRRGLAEISTLPPIKDKTRLIIGDALTLVLGNNWDQPLPGDSLFMSFDPVAHDTQGLKVLSQAITAKGRDPSWHVQQAGYWLASGVELGLGTNDPAQMDFMEETLA
jgi:uncharacterized protein (DUF362 family)